MLKYLTLVPTILVVIGLVGFVARKGSEKQVPRYAYGGSTFNFVVFWHGELDVLQGTCPINMHILLVCYWSLYFILELVFYLLWNDSLRFAVFQQCLP